MSSTERLRALLDERGESYVENDFGITWSYYSDPHTATESMDGTLQVTGLTPKQAIAATLGAGTCHNANVVMNSGEICFRCSECGSWDYTPDPVYCHDCGCKVVDE